MQITCNDCHKRYKIRDDKLPVGKKIATRCPACKGLIRIDLRTQPLEAEKSKKTASSQATNATAVTVATQKHSKKQPDGIALKSGLLRSLSDLPAMPDIVNKARSILSDPGSSVRELAKVVELEPAIATRLLRIANSAYYGFAGKVASVQHASVLLGYKTLGELVALAGVSNLMSRSLEGYGLESDDVWHHSIAVATGSRIIARRKFPELENDAFTAGLIHDTGKLILNPLVYDRRDAFDEVMQSGQKTFLWAEREILGFDHAEIASEFCEKWNIPSTQAAAIKFHHSPSLSNGNYLAYILHAADIIAMQNNLGTGIDAHLYQPEEGAMEFLGLDDHDQAHLMKEMADTVENISGDINVTDN